VNLLKLQREWRHGLRDEMREEYGRAFHELLKNYLSAPGVQSSLKPVDAPRYWPRHADPANRETWQYGEGQVFSGKWVLNKVKVFNMVFKIGFMIVYFHSETNHNCRKNFFRIKFIRF